MTDEDSDQVVDQIVAHMRGRNASREAAVVDGVEQRMRVIGDGPPDTHVTADEVASSPNRYTLIPTRERIESREHIQAFIHDYLPNEPYLFDQAVAALKGTKSAGEWRTNLGDKHRAVQAFDVYMDDFYHVVARMLLHGAKRPRVGMLSHMKTHFEDM